jgi:hypothetical protein
MMIPTIAMAIFMGILPGIFLRPLAPASARLIERVTGSLPARVSNQPPEPAVTPAPAETITPGAPAGSVAAGAAASRLP